MIMGESGHSRSPQSFLIQSLKGLRMEIRQGVLNLRNSLGGSHSEFPFG